MLVSIFVLVGEGGGRHEFLDFLPYAVGLTPILNIAAQLVLPVCFTVCKSLMVPLFHLVNYLYGNAYIFAALGPPIVVAQPPNLVFNFLLVSTVAFF